MANFLGILLVLLLAFAVPEARGFLATSPTNMPIESVPRVHHLNKIRNEILKLADEEKKAEEATHQLLAEPRADVLTVLKEDITARAVSPPVLTLKAAEIVDAVELLQTSESWFVVKTAFYLGRQADEALRSKLIAVAEKAIAVDPPSLKTIALLEGLTAFHEPLTSGRFRTLITSTDFRLRIAAVENFLAGRKRLSAVEQSDRYRLAFVLKPYQARQPAMENFSHLQENEKSLVSAAVSQLSCRGESRDDVRTLCLSIGGQP